MTIPILPIPNTTPSYAFQVPGAGTAMAQGLEGVIQALLQKAKLDQGQQQLSIQSRDVAQQGQYQQGLLQDRATQQAMDQLKLLRESHQQGELGNAIGALLTPQPTGPINLPGGGIMNPSLPTDPQQVLAQTSPEVRGELVKSKAWEQATQTQTQRREAQVMDQTIKALPVWMQSAAQASAQLIKAGLGKEQAGEMFTLLVGNNATPENLAQIDREFPEFATLSVPDKLKTVLGIRQLQAERRLGVGAENARQVAARQAEVRLSLDRARLAMDREKEPGSKLSAVMALLRIVDQQVNDLTQLGLTNPDLIGRPTEEKVKGVFGDKGLKAYQDAVLYLQQAIPNPVP